MSSVNYSLDHNGNRMSSPGKRPVSCGGLPEFRHQAAEVTTPSESRAARSVGVIPFGGAPISIPRRFSGVKIPAATTVQSHLQKEQYCPKSSLVAPVWNVTDENLPVLPELYPLECTAVFVPHTKAPVVAERITNCLKSRSICATFVADGKKAKAKCVTSDFPSVEFRIFLYRGKKTYSHGIIVEVQRRYGFSMNYFMDVKAIFDSAEGNPPVETTFSLPEVSPVSDDSSSEDDNDDLVSFETGEKMLQDKDSSNSFLGLQYFVSMTDCRKTGASRAHAISRRLLQQGCEDSRKIIMDLTRSTDITIQENILRLWNNIISSLARKDLLLIKLHEDFFTTMLIPLLAQAVKGAKNDSLSAHIALRCVYNTLKNFPTFFTHAYVGNTDFMKALEEAKDTGSLSRYATLVSGTLSCTV